MVLNLILSVFPPRSFSILYSYLFWFKDSLTALFVMFLSLAKVSTSIQVFSVCILFNTSLLFFSIIIYLCKHSSLKDSQNGSHSEGNVFVCVQIFFIFKI